MLLNGMCALKVGEGLAYIACVTQQASYLIPSTLALLKSVLGKLFSCWCEWGHSSTYLVV